MRCHDVTRELSAPTGAFGPASLAEHLAGCARCASWAERSARLDRVWEATRPAGLSDAAWDRIWANVSEGLDRPALPAARPTPAAPRPWRRRAMAAFVLAEAAVILLGFVALLRTSTSERRTPPQAESPLAAFASSATPDAVEVESGQVLLYSFDRRTMRDLAQNENPYAIDPFLPMANYFESVASLQ